MIVRERPSGLRLFLLLRGSILQRIRLTLLVNTLLALTVTLVHGHLFTLKVTLTPVPFTLIGLPLAIFLGFRNTAAYDRYWEARKLWGEITLRLRTLSRQCQSLIATDAAAGAQTATAAALDVRAGADDVRVRMVHRGIAFAHALRLQLRGQSDPALLQRWLGAHDWALLQRQRAALPDALLLAMGRDLGVQLRSGRIAPCLAAAVDATLSALTSAAAACERIKNTPVPFSYTLLLHRTAYLYCFLLPFGLVDIVGFMTPFVVAIVAYTFFGLDAVGDELEEPFGLESNDLPLDTLCRGIEISLLASLGETELPAPLAPVDYQLT
ncbi:MAG: bestrophin [Comamonadaceae bacterium]|nr:bestrophin [Comamonadaceae bacterium]